MRRLTQTLRRDGVDQIGSAAEILSSNKAAVLTGAGVSTDSGIPDYRGKGAPVRKPMVISDFVNSAAMRRRYWAGATAGWLTFNSVQPNAGHKALADLQHAGFVSGLTTQNVDRLHEKAGSTGVVHIHGFVDKVVCLNCNHLYDREIIERQLSELNPQVDLGKVALRPDGDVATDPSDDFNVPQCRLCGGMLKPSVVFFGETVPLPLFDDAKARIEDANSLVIAGSSLAVNSGLRLVKIARARNLPIIVINRGPTAADRFATLRVEDGTSDFLHRLSERVIGTGADLRN